MEGQAVRGMERHVKEVTGRKRREIVTERQKPQTYRRTDGWKDDQRDRKVYKRSNRGRKWPKVSQWK